MKLHKGIYACSYIFIPKFHKKAKT